MKKCLPFQDNKEIGKKRSNMPTAVNCSILVVLETFGFQISENEM